ncbi:MAG TPA: uroporphyrinogen-III synthase [Terracidiphilus sp.]|nr:uroporphyrinogen-III synthase [Terracidiphilus sp.]
MNSGPLAGRCVLVTRAAGQASKLSDELRALGAVPIEVPVIEICPPESYDGLDSAFRQLDTFDWLLFTSTNSVAAFQSRAMNLGISLTDLKPQIAAVGKATAQALETLMHLRVSLTPKEYVAESLVAALKDQISGKRVLLARAAVARDVIPDALRASGASVDVVDAYQNVLPFDAPSKLRKAVSESIDAATFTSSSSVTHLAEAAHAADIPFPLPEIPAVSIGPITSQTLRELGWPPAVEADPHDIPGLIQAVRELLS